MFMNCNCSAVDYLHFLGRGEGGGTWSTTIREGAAGKFEKLLSRSQIPKNDTLSRSKIFENNALSLNFFVASHPQRRFGVKDRRCLYKSDTLSWSQNPENDTQFSGTSQYGKIYEYLPRATLQAYPSFGYCSGG